MECKSRIMSVRSFSLLRINRYIMECKLKPQKNLASNHEELIDTLWNVN